ncbi:MAG TPA: proline racemase family protein [Thermomicrobiaceae bacterium]|nr:proline racemase family protein [Thermomicrobiaceae bacterium]
MSVRRTITTIDAHAGGEPLRLITSGLPRLTGGTILDRRREMLEQYDDIRRALMWEPRGHADMYGAILTPPVTPGADYGVLFMHNEGYSTMCGHGTIALATILIETGIVPVVDEAATIRFNTPAGLVTAYASVREGRAVEVRFENVPSFVYSKDVNITTSLGEVTVPVVFGGAFYALVESNRAGLKVVPEQSRRLIDFGMEIKRAVEAKLDVHHPFEPELEGIYGTIITDASSTGADGRNVTIFADGEVDRSPCGTGTAARLAWLHAQGELTIDQPYVHESITGSRFSGRVLRTTRVAEWEAVVPEIAGRAYLTGFHTFIVEPDDPFANGFLVR